MLKMTTNTVLDHTGAPAFTWLLCLMYVCFIPDHTICLGNNNHVPLEVATGSTPDISPLLNYYFWQKVYYKVDDSDFPSKSGELTECWVGIAKHVRHAMTYEIPTDDMCKVISWWNIHPFDPKAPNL